MKYLLLFCFITPAYAIKYDTIFSQVKRNAKHLPAYEVGKITVAVLKMAKKYKINPKLYAAILMQESSYNVKAKNCNKIKCFDYGMSQINNYTILRYEFNKDKLITDVKYSIEAGAKVLYDIKRMYAKKEQDWWTRYNAKSDDKRQIYKEKVMRWL